MIIPTGVREKSWLGIMVIICVSQILDSCNYVFPMSQLYCRERLAENVNILHTFIIHQRLYNVHTHQAILEYTIIEYNQTSLNELLAW